jgi:uncharacterized protein (DUF1501 family)
MERRKFIKRAGLGAILPSLFGNYEVKAVGYSPWLQSLTNTAAETDHVLVVVRFNGGNDGMNMVIALDQYDNLSEARGNILISENDVLRLSGVEGTGLHPAMKGLQTLYDEGKLKIAQAVGYPNQNFSHFRSSDIWMSASESTENVTTGWVGRYLSTEYSNYPEGFPNNTMPDPLAIQLNEMTLTFQGASTVMGVTLTDPNNPYDFLDDPSTAASMGRKVAKEMTYLRTIAKQADKYGEIIKVAYNKAKTVATYPTSSLANQLKIVARLIKGGLKTRVYMVQMGGFDTHAGQVTADNHSIGTHASLMQQISEGITAFQRDCEEMDIDNRVIGMTFSEFGRRMKSNASGGTDHGAALPMFVWGTRLYGGMLGENPTVGKNLAVNANVPMQIDFRSIYASILKDWFCVADGDLQNIMLRNFQHMPIVNSPICVNEELGLLGNKHDQNVAAGTSLISNYPNPFDSSTNIQFQTRGGHTLVQIFDVEGQLIATPVDGIYAEGRYRANFSGDFLPAGIYYMRLQNEVVFQVKTMVKVR